MEITPKEAQLKSPYSSLCCSVESSPSDFKEEKVSSILFASMKYTWYLYFNPVLVISLNKLASLVLPPCDSFPPVIPQHHPKLSASLKERLKRTRRSFISPQSVAKRLCVDDEEEEEGQQLSAVSKETPTCPPLTVQSIDENRNEVTSGNQRFSGPVPKHDHSEEFLQKLRKEVKEKTETLRRLKMVKMYRCKVSGALH